jgi:hypothetical protein
MTHDGSHVFARSSVRVAWHNEPVPAHILSGNRIRPVSRSAACPRGAGEPGHEWRR